MFHTGLVIVRVKSGMVAVISLSFTDLELKMVQNIIGVYRVNAKYA